MTYEELNEMFNGGQIDDSYLPFIQDLTYMRELSAILTKVKKRQGHLDFESSDISIVKDIYENDKILEFESRQQDEAEKLIENFMVLANENVAADFYWRELPFIYRTHDTPEEMKLEDTIEELRGRFGKEAITYASLLGDLKIPTDGREKVKMPGAMFR